MDERRRERVSERWVEYIGTRKSKGKKKTKFKYSKGNQKTEYI